MRLAEPPDTELRPTHAAQEARPLASKPLPETEDALPWHGDDEVQRENNPFSERDWRMVGYAWTGFILRIVLILGALFSVFQFLAAREEKRVERTLQLVELWEREDYQAAQQALRERLAGLNEKYASLLGKSPTQSEMSVYSEKVGLEAMSPDGGTMPLPEFRKHFDRIVYFLNRLSFCVEGNLCSSDVADAYFRDYAVSFWTYFAGYVADQRKAGLTTYALPVERYVNRDAAPAAEAK